MRIVPAISWTLATHPAAAVDDRLIPLLDAIAHRRSLSAAVIDCGISYRAAWGLLRDYQHRLGTVLVDLERGRGARLAPARTYLHIARDRYRTWGAPQRAFARGTRRAADAAADCGESRPRACGAARNSPGRSRPCARDLGHGEPPCPASVRRGTDRRRRISRANRFACKGGIRTVSQASAREA